MAPARPAPLPPTVVVPPIPLGAPPAPRRVDTRLILIGAAVATGASLLLTLRLFVAAPKSAPAPTVTPPAVAPPAVAPPAPAVTPPAPADTARLVLATDQALRAREWDQAIAHADRILRLDPENPTARAQRERAVREKKAKVLHEALHIALDGNQPDMALRLFDSIPPDSVYHAEDAPLVEPLRRRPASHAPKHAPRNDLHDPFRR